MSGINEMILRNLSSLNKVNYREIFLNTVNPEILDKVSDHILINENLLNEYLFKNELSEEVCELFYTKYNQFFSKDSFFMRLFNHTQLKDDYIKKIVNFEMIDKIEKQGLIDYFYKEYILTTEGLFRVYNLYPEIFFKDENIPMTRFYTEDIDIYKKNIHIMELFATNFKNNPKYHFDIDEKKIAILFNLELISIDDISIEFSKKIEKDNAFDLQPIIDKNLLNKDIINKLFNFEMPLIRDEVSFDYKKYIKGIPNHLINEKDKKGNCILTLLKEIKPAPEVSDLLYIILEKGYDITKKNENGESIFLIKMESIGRYYNYKFTSELIKSALNFIIENIDNYAENKKIICEIGNKLFVLTGLVDDDSPKIMESFFAENEKKYLNNLLTEEEKIEVNNKGNKRL